ncbi:SPT3 Dosage dependent suppressor of Ty-induced promoter mutations-like protein [Linnemannia gamsii]|uniref:SPT3 Dosage dependent suppressor of Ty-induced promoter mutations-like protein n=1 Tax=Linnemannia gamsii TaxID=64522 RepID=A0ABQ7K6D5_9FUNG|nr:SPT3 Dosage dependent suppressor of Ty-induced promoter mutations-like protein [Linnemannia gamsii]
MTNLYARSLHTPFYQDLTNGVHLGFGSQANGAVLQGSHLPLAHSGPLLHATSQSHSDLPAFDVKAYTFRKKPRHYVAVKHKNALRIEPIIYLKTSILDSNRQVVRNWDYLRFNLDRFRENAQPKKKLSPDEMRGARILDVDIVLISPNNRDRIIEDSCPACVMRMDGERKIMQVLAKNFKQSPNGEPMIDIRKGHAIICIKLNCYCDHHNEQEGFVVRLQTFPEVVRVGGSVKLRICCEARSKNGGPEQDQEEEDGLTDIDAPASTGSRSPAMAPNEQMLQSPSLSNESSRSPMVKSHQRTPSASSASMASPRSMDERVVNSLAMDNANMNGLRTGHSINGTNGRAMAPPKFRQIYPLTPCEGTILGGTRVTIHGANFDLLQNPVVFFGKVPAELVTISHHDVMECTTPPAENLKPGIVAVKIASMSYPIGPESDQVDYMYMAPPDYDFCNLAATSLSYAMSNEYPQDNTLAYMLNSHGAGSGIGLGLLDDATTFVGNDFDVGFAWSTSAKEDMALEFLRTIQTLAPGRILPSFRSDSGHTMLHLAAQQGMARLSKELIAMGIDHTAIDRNNKTALQFARMSGHEDIARLISEAKVPPRPMVPRMETAQHPGATMQQTVAALVQKHQENLVKVVRQEGQRSHRQLREMKERATHVMDIKNQALTESEPRIIEPAEATATDENHTHGDSPATRQKPPKVFVEEAEEDDIMVEEMSNASSPEGAKSHDEDMDSNDESGGPDHSQNERKRKALEAPDDSNDATRKLVKDDDTQVVHAGPGSLSSKVEYLTPAQHGHILNATNIWEKSRGTELFGSTAALLTKTGLQTWTCDTWSAPPLKGSTETALPDSQNDTALHVMALTGTGLHHFTEHHSLQGTLIRDVEHWSLVELEHIGYTASSPSHLAIDMEMCGLGSRGGRDPLGQRIRLTGSKENLGGYVNAVSKAHDELMRHLDFKPKFGATPQQHQPHQHYHLPTEKTDDWIDATLTMWAKLFKLSDRDLNGIDYSARLGTFTLEPAQDDMRAHSAPQIQTVMRMLRQYDEGSKVRFEGIQVWDGAWKKPEVIQDLQRMIKDMRHIERWNFAGCGWSSETAQGFLDGFEPTADSTHILRGEAGREHCRRISLAGNDFGGEDTVGHLFAKRLATWRHFKTLDLTDCNIGVSGIEALVGRLENMLTIRLKGNQADNRWWQWVDMLLERNPDLQKCRLGAPVAPSVPHESLLSGKRLDTLQELTVLDLSTAPINQATISVLAAYVPSHPELLTLALSRCNLSWSSVVSVFDALCEVNQTTKFTLDVSQNPLFDSKESADSWIQSLERSRAFNSGEPFGIHMQGLIVRDAVLGRVLEALEQTTCFNELNVNGLLIKRESQVAELEGLSYQEACAKIRPEDASDATCRALGRMLALNKTLIMLDISGKEIEQQDPDVPATASSTGVSALVGSSNSGGRRSNMAGGRSMGGFGRRISLAFPALAENDTLKMLVMDYNRFGEDGMATLAQALRSNRKLGVLSCDGNDAYTHKGLKAVESALPPFGMAPASSALSIHGATSGRSSSSMAPSGPVTYRGTIEEAQAAGYNSTLSVWGFNPAEILLHQDVMSVEVERRLAEFNRIEKLQSTAREQEAKFGPRPAGGVGELGVAIGGAALLEEAKRLHQVALDDRAEYSDCHYRIRGAIKENNRRTKEVYERELEQAEQLRQQEMPL